MILPASRDHIRQAADALEGGQLVVLPTETVYGLAADIRQESAISSIFRLKGRPADNPLIVHLHDAEMAKHIAIDLPESYFRLGEKFWPGPLSLVVRKHPRVSDLITAGGETVAIRVPDHPVTLAVMSQLDLMLAMPSANVFTSLSPTRAEMVSSEIENGVWGILDGGPCTVGIESTVLDLSGSKPTILREGVISKDEIEECLREVVLVGPNGTRSPGQYRRHYAPRTVAVLVDTFSHFAHGISYLSDESDQIIQLGDDPKVYARGLYAALAELDARGVERIEILRPPETNEWAAIWDRVLKATTSV